MLLDSLTTTEVPDITLPKGAIGEIEISSPTKCFQRANSSTRSMDFTAAVGKAVYAMAHCLHSRWRERN